MPRVANLPTIRTWLFLGTVHPVLLYRRHLPNISAYTTPSPTSTRSTGTRGVSNSQATRAPTATANMTTTALMALATHVAALSAIAPLDDPLYFPLGLVVHR